MNKTYDSKLLRCSFASQRLCLMATYEAFVVVLRWCHIVFLSCDRLYAVWVSNEELRHPVDSLNSAQLSGIRDIRSMMVRSHA